MLFGDYNPGGRLVNLAQVARPVPPMMDYDIRHGRTYMYFKGEPLYPFGFGLSYTTFPYSNLARSRACARRDARRERGRHEYRQADGRRGGAALRHHLKSKVERPRKELRGFRRVTLKPGEARTVRIPSKVSRWPGGTRRPAASRWKRSRSRC